MPDTVGANTSTTAGLTSISDSDFGTVDFSGDADWYRVALAGGYGYQVWIEGAHFGRATLLDPYLRIYSPAGSFLEGNDDYNHYLEGIVPDAFSYFVASASGTYFLGASAFGFSDTGTYLLTILRDELAGVASAATIAVNSALVGTLGEGIDSSDWYRVSLISGVTYQFDLIGSVGDGLGAAASLPDPFLFLRNGSGDTLAFDEQSGVGNNARITFTAPQTATYFLDARESVFTFGAETYQLIVNASPVSGSLDLGVAKTGSIDFLGDIDLYSVQLVAGSTYRFSMKGINLPDAYLEVLDFTRNVVGTSDDGGGGNDSALDFTPGTGGTYYLGARSFANRDTGTYSVSVSTGGDQAADIFRIEGEGSTSTGWIRTMADFSKAAYAVQSWESSRVVPSADAALQELVADGWRPVPLAVQGPTSGPSSEINMAAGFYTNANAAAFVARCQDALVLSFRGTNDLLDAVDDLQVLSFSHHYDLMRPLVAAVERYVDDPLNGITSIYVTGHSLGGAMAIRFMDDHPSPLYHAVTFAAPAVLAAPDDRVTLMAVVGDPIASVGSANGHTVHFETGIDTFNPLNLHAMDLYREIADSVTNKGWDQILSTLDHMNPRVGLAAALTASGYTVDRGGDVLIDPLDHGEPESNVGIDIFYGGTGDDQLIGGFSADILLGGPGNDFLDGGSGDDLVVGGDGSDSVFGRAGIDVLSFVDSPGDGAERWAFAVSRTATRCVVTDNRTGDADTLVGIERLEFLDRWVALDLDGNAGTAAKILGAVFGASSATNAEYVGIALSLLDDSLNWSASAVAGVALNARLGAGASAEAVVNLLYANVMGHAPDTTELALYVDMLRSGDISSAQLALVASNHAANVANVNLVGLAATGLEYISLA